MIKLVFCLTRKAELTREGFQHYWRHNHAPLVARNAPALRLRRYVQVHTTESQINAGLQRSRGGPDAYDGVAELWWDSLDEMLSASSSPEGQRAGAELLEDEKKFIDLARSPIFVAEEHVIVGEPAHA